MASSLLSNISSEAQRKANLLTNTPNRVRVLVEDELDVVFWKRVLRDCVPWMQFEVYPYSYDGSYSGKGKAQILGQTDRFGEYMIGCVDSDHDWLLQDYTDEGNIIRNSHFIFQTYAYSIENLAAWPTGLSDCMLECSVHCCELQRTLDEDFISFLTKLSVNVYDVLLWHLILKKECLDLEIISSGWQYIFCNVHYEDINRHPGLSEEDKRLQIMERMSERAHELAVRYEARYPQLKSVRSALESELRMKCGLDPADSFLHVRGHDFHDFILHNFFKPVVRRIRILHEDEIKARTSGSETGDAIRHYHSLLKDFGRDYIHRPAYMTAELNPLVKRIKNDIAAVFKHPGTRQ